MLADNGYISTIRFLSILLIALKTCTNVRKRIKNVHGFEWAVSCANMFQTSLMAYCVGGAFLSQAYHDFLYHILFLTGSLEFIVNREIAIAKQKANLQKNNNDVDVPVPFIQ